MNQLNGIIKNVKSVEGITHIHVEVKGKTFSSLILSGDEEYQKQESVTLLFKETEVMIATSDSMVSARNAFISPITFIDVGKILVRVEFDFGGVKISSIITKDALDQLKCKVEDEFQWFVKSNEILIQKG